MSNFCQNNIFRRLADTNKLTDKNSTRHWQNWLNTAEATHILQMVTIFTLLRRSKKKDYDLFVVNITQQVGSSNKGFYLSPFMEVNVIHTWFVVTFHHDFIHNPVKGLAYTMSQTLLNFTKRNFGTI